MDPVMDVTAHYAKETLQGLVCGGISFGVQCIEPEFKAMLPVLLKVERGGDVLMTCMSYYMGSKQASNGFEFGIRIKKCI